MAECGKSQCDWCLKDKKTVPASRYCHECVERLCTACATYHSRGRLQADHNLLDIEGKHVSSEEIQFIRMLKTCPKHSANRFEYICKTHDQECCNVCVIETYRTCDRLVPLSKECGNRTTEPGSTTLNALIELDEQATTLLSHENNNQCVITASKKRLIQELDNVKSDLNHAFKVLKHKVLNDVDKRSKRLLQTSVTSCGEIVHLSNDIMSAKCQAKMVVDKCDPILCYLFDRQQHKLNTVHNFRSKATELKDMAQKRDIKLVKIKSVSKICESISKCLKVEDDLSTPDFLSSHSSASDDVQEVKDVGLSFRNVRLEYENDISEANSIICACVWINKFIILANNTKNELIQFDSNQRVKVSTYRCLTYPSSIVVIGDTHIAVCYDKEVIDILSVHQSKLKHEQKLKLNTNVLAASLNKSDNKLVCLSPSSRCLSFISLNDQTIHSLADVKELRSELSDSCDIVYDNKTSNIFVTCHFSNKVLSFDSHGNNIRTIVSCDQVGIMSPLAITVDNDSHVYIVNKGEHSILQYDQNLKFIRKFIPGDIRLGDPICMSFNEDMTRLAVAGRGPGKQLKVFCFD